MAIQGNVTSSGGTSTREKGEQGSGSVSRSPLQDARFSWRGREFPLILTEAQIDFAAIARIEADNIGINEPKFIVPPDLTGALAKALAATYGDAEGRDAFVEILDTLNDGLAHWGESVERLRVATESMDFASRSLTNVYQTFSDLSGEKLAELGRGFVGLAGAFERIDLEQLNAVRDTINKMLDAAMKWREFELSQPGRTSDSGQKSEPHAFNAFGATGADDLLIGGAGNDILAGARGLPVMPGEGPGWPIFEITPELEKLGSALDELDFDWQQTFDRMKGVMLDFAETGKFEWRDLARIALDSIEDMLQGWLKLQQQKAGQGGENDPWSMILNTAGSALGGLFGGGGGFSPSGASGSWAAGLDITGVPGAPTPHFADGGPIAAGMLAMVGERGPELFVPRIPGDIVPNHALGAMRGGAEGGRPVIVNLNVSPGVPEAVRREVAALMPQITAAAKLGVAGDMDRNGSLRRRVG